MFGDLFRGNDAPEQKQDDATGGLMAEVKANTTPSRKDLKFKTAKGNTAQVSCITQSEESLEPILKEVCDAIDNGTLEPEREAGK